MALTSASLVLTRVTHIKVINLQKKYFQGETVSLNVETRNTAGALADVTTVTATVWNPVHTKVVDAAALSNTAVGKYTGTFATTTAWLNGEYVIQILATSVTDKSVAKDTFVLEVVNG